MIQIPRIARHVFEVAGPHVLMELQLRQNDSFQIEQVLLPNNFIANKITGYSGIHYSVEERLDPSFPGKNKFIFPVTEDFYNTSLLSHHTKVSMTRINFGAYSGVEKWALYFKDTPSPLDHTSERYIFIVTDVNIARDLSGDEEVYLRQGFDFVDNISHDLESFQFFVAEKVGSVIPFP